MRKNLITETIQGEDTIVTETVKGEDRVIVQEGSSFVERVKTGDPAVILPLIGAMALCAAVIGMILVGKKKKEQEEEVR